MEVVGKKLDEITQKLEAMTGILEMLTESIQKMEESLGETVGRLTETVKGYVEVVTERSDQEFEHYKGLILDVSGEVQTLNKMTGIQQIIQIGEALNNMSALLHQAIDPNSLHAKLNDITNFIKTQGGKKE